MFRDGPGPAAVTAPVWMATPPEVHSGLLSSGPGPGSLLAAAAQWTALSTEYTEAAAELSALLGAVQGGSWEGPTAAQYAAAHVPYLTWLTQASAHSAVAAAQHQTAAAAYESALATMPTLPELAANHAVHGVLVATNFFGINTIPIALNEADYIRMWVQASATMTAYQAISDSALTSATPTETAPRILAAEAAPAEPATTPPADPIEELLAWSEHFTSMYRALKGLLLNPVGTIVQLMTDFATNPAAAAVTWLPLFYVGAYAAAFAAMGTPGYAAVAGPSVAIPLALGLSALASVVEVPVVLAVDTPGVAPDLRVVPVASITPTVTTAGAAPAPSVSSPAPAPAAPASAPPAAGFTGFAYLVGGLGPGPTLGPLAHTKATASAPASGISAAAAAAAAAGAKAKARRRRRQDVKNRGYRDEYLTLDDAPDWTPEEPPEVPSAAASESGAGPIGFTGTTTRSESHAAGLTTLAGDSFTDAPTVPMMPGTWGTDTGPADGDGHSAT